MPVTGKYKQLVDPEIQQFIKGVENWYPEDATNLSIAGQREVYNALCAAYSVPCPGSVISTDMKIGQAERSVSCRRYRNKRHSALARVLYFHGGGFVLGGLQSHDGLCAQICDRTGFDLISVDYRLAPEHRFPADIQDAQIVFDHLMRESPTPTILLGDSAGASIAAALSHHARMDERPPIGQILIYPMLGSNWLRPSFKEHANAPLLTTQDVIYYATMRCGDDLQIWHDRQCSPLNDPDMSDLPPTIVFVAELDPLRDDGAGYCAAINAAGGDACLVEESGLVHSFIMILVMRMLGVRKQFCTDGQMDSKPAGIDR